MSVFNSFLFKDIFGTEPVRQVFSEDRYIEYLVQTEVALAKAQSAHGVIPKEAGDKIAQFKVDTLNKPLLAAQTAIVGYPILPLVEQMSSGVPDDCGRYVHWGATTQDIMDTASVLQMRDALTLVESLLKGVVAQLHRLAAKYRDTPMAGRTHWQHALPVTFGYKCAVWVSGLERSLERLAQLKPRCLMVQFGGAAGTLASLKGSDGLLVRETMAGLLGLTNPTITWHVARDGVAEILNFLAVVCGSLGKVALDVIAMSSNELGEVSEPYVHHRGASSTMPQKRNPISSEFILAASKITRANAGLGLDGMVSDFERASGPWHLEWMAIPESFITTVSALHQTEFIMTGLVVNQTSMLGNLNSTRGLIVAEAVMMGLAPTLGRQAAHDVVYECCVASVDQDKSLLEVLVAHKAISGTISPEDLGRLCDPVNYLGCSGAMVDTVVGKKTNGYH